MTTTAGLAPIAKIEWRRPMIMDITPPNAAARHQQIKKHWKWQRKRRAEERPSKPEDVRLAHLRWRELQRLLRHRYGVVMPDTFEARRDLEILIGYAALTGKKPQHQVELLAPWLDQDEADHLAAQRAVLHDADDLAERLDLRYCDRQRLAIRTIGAIDCDKAERERLRRQRQNERKRQKRAAPNQKSSAMIDRPPMRLTPRQLIVLKMIGSAEIAAPALVGRLARCKVFRGASMRQRVHEALDHLVAAGLVANRYAPGRTRPIRHVSRRQQPSR
jgi:hypothetical protein